MLLRSVIAAAVVAAVALAGQVPASAGRSATDSERAKLRRAADLPRSTKFVAVRSQVSRKWAVVVTKPANIAERRTFLLRLKNGKWRKVLSAGRGEETWALCKRKNPPAPVAFDLGFSDSSIEDGCKYKRKRLPQTRRMTAAEVQSVRQMVEWKQDPDTFEMVPGPVQPRVSDVNSVGSCNWNGGGALQLRPFGRVARPNARWGVVYVGCVIGSDGFSLMEERSSCSSRAAALVVLSAGSPHLCCRVRRR